jgi:S-layer protein
MATNYTAEVTQLYHDIQYRAPDAADLNTYVALLSSGQETLAQVQTAVEIDPYTQNIVDPVIREYQAAFGRVPDQAGVAYWVNVIAAGSAMPWPPLSPAALTTLSTTFANSVEFDSRYGATATTVGTSALVSALYENVLGRAPDAPGLTYWVGQNLTAAQLLQVFAQSPEFITDTASAIIAFQNDEAAGAPPTTGSLLTLSTTPGETIALTPGQDTITPPTTNNNTITATNLTLNAFDSINLGTTTGNVFDWVYSPAPPAATPSIAVVDYKGSVTVADVQTANFDSTTALALDTTGWLGLNTLNVTTFNGSTQGSIISADTTTAVNVTDTAENNVTLTNGLTVNGGSIDTIVEHNGAFNSSFPITINGGVGTTQVSVTQDFTLGGSDQNVHIVDTESAKSAGTIASVALSGSDGNTDTITSGALTNLAVSNSVASTIEIFDASAATPAATLNLTLAHVTGLVVNDEGGEYTKLNVTTNTTTNSLRVFGSSITAEPVTGTGVLSQTSADMTALATIAISGAAGFTDTDLIGTGVTSVTSTSTGTITVTLNDEQTTFTGGPGTDIVTVAADATVAITGGSATNNEIVFNEPGANLSTPGSYHFITGFEILGTNAASVGSYNLTGFSAPISNVDVQTASAGALTFINSASTQTLSVDSSLLASGGITLTQQAGLGAHNILNLNIGTAATAGIDTSNTAAGATFPVGTVSTVAEHAGLTTTTVAETAFIAPTAWTETLTLSEFEQAAQPATVGLFPGDAVGVTWSSNIGTTDATQLAAAINADPTESLLVTAGAGGTALVPTVVLTAKAPGTAFNATVVTLTDGGSGTLTGTNVPGTAGTAGHGTLTVTGTNSTANQVTVSDSAGPVGAVIKLVGGETENTVATDIAAQLTADLFTGVVVTGNAITYTYPVIGQSGLTTSDAVSQLDTVSLAGITVAANDKFSETITSATAPLGVTVTYTAVLGDTPATVAAGLAALINAQTGTTDVAATSTGGNVYLTSTVATQTFTDSGVTETSFGAVGSQAITANGYQTVNLDSEGTNLGVANTTYLVDNALASLVITGANDLTLATNPGGHPGALASITTSGAAGVEINLTGVLASEVTTGITATLGAADVTITGNAATGSTDTFTGSGSSDITGTTGGGNSIVTFTDGVLNTVDVGVSTGTANVVTLGNGTADFVADSASGTALAPVADSITLGNGAHDLVEVSGNGFSTFTVVVGNGLDSEVTTSIGAATVTLGNGDGDILDTGAGAVTATLGNGTGDTVDLGAGAATVTLGTGLGDDVVFGTGLATVTFGTHIPSPVTPGQFDTANFTDVLSPSYLTPTTTSQVAVLTSHINIVTGLVAGDHIILPVTDTIVMGGANGAGIAGDASFASGTYSAAAGTFSFGASGHDSLLTYDSTALHTGVYVSVVLVGTSVTSHVSHVGDNITLA